MKVHIIKPYALDMNLGKAYNDTISLFPDEDWICVCDYDTMFLTPNCGEILHNYAEMFPDFGVLTCWTNRIHGMSTHQLYGGKINEDDSIRNHIKVAEDVQNDLYTVTDLGTEISGFLMMFSKQTWNKIKFKESGKALGVDNWFAWDLLAAGYKVGRMNGLYVWHTYRLKNGVLDKSHLQ